MAGRSQANLHLNYPEGLRGTSLEAKILYTRLLCDDALNHAGILPLRVALWADDTEMTEGATDKALQELEDKRFAFTDYRTHQVLVRTLIRNDGIAGVPNVLWSACRSALKLRSEKLRRVLARELRRLPPAPPNKVNEKTGREYVYPDPHATADSIDPGTPEGPGSHAGTDVASHRASHTETDAASHPEGGETGPNGVSGYSEIASHPTSHAGSPGGGGGGGGGGETPVGSYSSSKTKLSRASRAKREPNLDGFDDFWDAYPSKIAKIKAKASYSKALDRGAEPAVLLSAARRYARWIAATGKQDYVCHPTTWLNQGRWDDELPEPHSELRLVTAGTSTHSGTGTSSQRANAILALRRGDTA